MTLKYQAEFTREARECSIVGGNMVMRVGVEGRVVVGPAGGPGQVDVPFRVAVVHESPSSGTRAISTKFFIIPVVIGPGQGGAPFSHVDRRRPVFPLPTPTAQLDDYIAYIGFDPLGAPRTRPSPRRRRNGRNRAATRCRQRIDRERETWPTTRNSTRRP